MTNIIFLILAVIFVTTVFFLDSDLFFALILALIFGAPIILYRAKHGDNDDGD